MSNFSLISKPVFSFCLLIVSLSGVTARAQTGRFENALDDFLEFVSGRLELGVGVNHVRLRETTRREFNNEGVFTGGFLGSIDQLHVQQRGILAPIVRLKFNENFGFQLGYRSYGARTTTFWNGHSDGSFQVNGPTLELFAKTKPIAGFSPYGAVGIAVLNGNFNHDELWHNGFSPLNPDAYRGWVNAGRPAWPNGGYRRTIDVDNTTALLLTGGCMYHINDQWKIDLSVQYMKADVDANYYLSWYGENRRDQGDFTIPMSNLNATLAVVYRF
jgi:opacity protein-like surface antigen